MAGPSLPVDSTPAAPAEGTGLDWESLLRELAALDWQPDRAGETEARWVEIADEIGWDAVPEPERAEIVAECRRRGLCFDAGPYGTWIGQDRLVADEDRLGLAEAAARLRAVIAAGDLAGVLAGTPAFLDAVRCRIAGRHDDSGIGSLSAAAGRHGLTGTRRPGADWYKDRAVHYLAYLHLRDAPAPPAPPAPGSQ